MPIIDFTNVEKVYRGSVEMKKVYEGQMVVWEKPVPIDYFYIQNEHAGSNILTLTKTGSALTTASDLEYSLDETNWTQFDLTQATNTVTIPQGEKVYMRSTTGFSTNSSNYLSITTSEDCSAGGDVMSLINYTNISSAPLRNSCFLRLFFGNTKLIDASDLQLPRTTLALQCYQDMFYDCTSLTQAPALPATTLAEWCYAHMFRGCTSLTQAPALPATTLASQCYQYMFYDCTSLTQAPALPATTLASQCYQYMFRGCTSLKEVWCYAQDIRASSCITSWLYGVANDGTLHKPIDNDSFPRSSTSGVPSSWHVEEIEDMTWGDEDYFRIYNMSSGTNTITLTNNGPATRVTLPNLKYSTDNGQTWTSWSGTAAQGNLSVTLQGKSYLLFKDGTAARTGNFTSSFDQNWWTFGSTANFKVSGSLSYFVNISSSNFSIGLLFDGATYLVGVNYNLLTPVSISGKTHVFYSLFRGCSNLVQAPNLTRTPIPTSGYAYMFQKCSKLKFIRCTATSLSSSEYSCVAWVSNVSSSGVFIKPSTVTFWPTGVSGIPSKWTVVNI